MKPFRILKHASFSRATSSIWGWIDGKEVEIKEIVCVIKEAEDVYIIETPEHFLLVSPPKPMNLEGMRRV